MRTMSVLLFLMLLGYPATAAGQSVEVYGSAGPTITDRGNSIAAGVGFSPASRLTILVSFDRTHLASSSRMFEGRVVSSLRGGTVYLGTGELRVSVFPRDRFGPFGLVGFGRGVGRANADATLPDPATEAAQAVFAGGGVYIPIARRLGLVIDARMMLATVGVEGLAGMGPVRAGLTWRF